jgi:hypothetical protein
MQRTQAIKAAANQACQQAFNPRKLFRRRKIIR